MSSYTLFLAVTEAGREVRWMGFDWNYWAIIGLIGTAIFSSRFIVQWIASEKAGDSVIPHSFWYLSIIGSCLLSVYFILQREPIGVLGYVPNSFIYIRNLILIKRKKQRDLQQAHSAPAPALAEK